MAKAIDSVENAAAHSHMLLEQTSNSQNIEENRQVETFNSVLILKSRWFGRTIERTYYVKIVEGTVVSADLTEKIYALSHLAIPASILSISVISSCLGGVPSSSF